MINSESFIMPDWPKPQNISAISSTRLGGLSEAPYDSLNLGLHTGDNLDNVFINREKLKVLAGAPQNIAWLKQVHGAKVLCNEYQSEEDEADAIITTRSNLALAIQTADCLPIFLASRRGDEIAAIHAGWRPLSQNIIANTVDKMKTPPTDILAWLGPCISQIAFEVGEEVKDCFSQLDSQHEAAFSSKDDKYLANLKAIATLELKKQGITHIWQDESCTFCDKERFFSYRRDKTTGRMASLIWLND